MIDMNTLEPGQDFDKLPETYVIWITEKDILGGNQPVYYINRRIDGSDEYFPDYEHIVYVNSEIQDDTALGRLMHDFHCKKADDMYYEVLAERVRELKETSKGVTEMCKELDELYAEVRNEAIAEGRAEGRAEGKTEGRTSAELDLIKNAMESFGITAEKAMEALKISMENRSVYLKKLTF